jgi:hypothetical protein
MTRRMARTNEEGDGDGKDDEENKTDEAGKESWSRRGKGNGRMWERKVWEEMVVADAVVEQYEKEKKEKNG